MFEMGRQTAELDENASRQPFSGTCDLPKRTLQQEVSCPVPQLAVPRRGHVLSRVAENYGRPIREAVSVLSGSLARKPQCSDLYETLFPSTDPWKPEPALVRSPAEMAAWALVSIWVTGVASGELSTSATLRVAEDWFFGDEIATRLAALPSARAIGNAEALLRKEANASAYRDLLPYILDPHGPGSRLSVKRDPTTRTAQARKRAEGVFYTPADVAHYMVATCLKSVCGTNPAHVFDPACGTGVFLRAALVELRNKYPSRQVSQLAADCLFGADIDPWPINGATFVLLTEILASGEINNCPPSAIWHRLRQNFACIDTLLVDPSSLDDGNRSTGADASSKGRFPLSRIFPALRNGPNVVVGNPPYANLGQRSDFATLRSCFATLSAKATSTAEIYLPFLEQMVRLSNGNQCAGALVLPLSIGCNVGAQFAAGRAMIAQTHGQWRFAFFDREPHALFGEDVKTRNAIVLWSRGPSEQVTTISSGPLRKWRGESRAAMFNSLRFTPIESDIRFGIPKIDGECQADALTLVSSRWTHLEQAVLSVGRATLDQIARANDKTVFVGPTAYNFLNVFLKPPQGLLETEKTLSAHPLHAIDCATREEALAVFAIMSSHLAYWWWHTHGDGFHVSRRTIASFPFGMETLTGDIGTQLSRCGAELWSLISSNPVISVNRGATSLAFTPNGHDGIRRQSDVILASVAGLDCSFVDELQKFTAHTVAATLRTHDNNRKNESERA